MPITTDFNTFANSYHKNTGNKYRAKLPNILIMDIIKMATEQKRVDDARANLEYWKELGQNKSTHNNTLIVNRMNLNKALKCVFNPIIEGDVVWTDDGLIETANYPFYEPEEFNGLWDLFQYYWRGAMVETPFGMSAWQIYS